MIQPTSSLADIGRLSTHGSFEKTFESGLGEWASEASGEKLRSHRGTLS